MEATSRKITVNYVDVERVVAALHIALGEQYVQSGRLEPLDTKNKQKSNDWFSKSFGLIAHEHPEAYCIMVNLMKVMDEAADRALNEADGALN